MSGPLALAAVTAVLKDLLNEGLINNDLAPVGTFSVTALPPDRITTGETEDNRLNLFLYQVTANQGWRNSDLASHSAGGERIANPPLALDLHYMLTAYGQTDLNAEILLGYAMEILHETRVLSRGAIRRSLSPNNPININLIPADSQGRTAADLADQVEAIKITPHYLSADELSRMWTAMQARYRPTVAYQVSTVLIQSVKPVRTAPPVLTRGSDDNGINSQPNLLAPPPVWPTLTGLEIATIDGGKREGAELGDTLVLTGALLTGDTVVAELRHRLLPVAKQLPVVTESSTSQLRVALPASDAGDAADWPAGLYTVLLRIESAGKPVRRSSELSFRLAPRLTAQPQLDTTGGALELTLQVAPPVWPGQQIDILLGGNPFPLPMPVAKTGTLKLSIKGIAPSEVPLPVLLRVDGVDSALVRDRNARPPRMDPQQTLEVPA